MKRRLLIVLALLLVGCARAPVREAADAGLLAAQDAREALLAGGSHWDFSGRLAVDAAGEGGSGRLTWRQQGADFEIQLSAPVTRKSWLLTQRGGHASLAGLDGGTRHGDDAEALLREATGWQLPVAALAAWARGARAAGTAQLEFGPDRLPHILLQQGWTVEYREWDGAQPPRPRRIFARSADASFRLVVDAWGEP
ncbi:MAG: outer membrane lipoprotein LolB [Arenimonas sp.]|nr:outer membrane lipoprotein LolB [Arenimonas sp.]